MQDNFSHFCQITFLNSLQAPNKQQVLFQSPAEQTACVSCLATFAFLLFILQIMEQTTLSPRQALNPSYIHRELPNLLFDRYIPGPHVPFSVHISTWRINTLHYHRFVIIYSVDKRFKLNERSLDNRNSGNQKHERYDFPCLSLPSWTPGTMHTMRGSSDRHLSSFYLQPSTLSTYHGLKSTNNTVQYFYSLTQSTRF